VAIDDFGTGYSSLGYLRKFPLDALKIDQSFVRQISIPGEDTAILTAVIVMARGLNLRVIAEGVETPGELDFLRAHQCNEAQGYYLSRPVAPEQFEKLLGTGISEAEIVGRPRVSSAPVAPKVLNARSATLRTLSLVGSNNGNSPIAPQARAPGSHSRSTDKDG